MSELLLYVNKNRFFMPTVKTKVTFENYEEMKQQDQVYFR